MPVVADGSPLAFPSDFPIKVMGRKQPRFVHAVTRIVRKHARGFDAATVEMRPNRQGKYLSVTCVVRATSRASSSMPYTRSSATIPTSSWCYDALVEDIVVKRLGRVAYEPTWEAMRAFTRARDDFSVDELWLLEHSPVYTVGQGAVIPPLANAIPVVKATAAISPTTDPVR